MLFDCISFFILLHFVALSKPEELNITLDTNLERQNKLFSILYHVHQATYPQEQIEIANAWTLEEHEDDFSKPDVVTKFIHHYKNGLLSKEAVFTLFYDSHLEEAIAVFRLFFYAKDWDTFYKTVVWARINVNSQIFVYSLYVAVDHREDCRNLVLPPIYEVSPYLFFDALLLGEAAKRKGKFDSDLAEALSKNDLWIMEPDPNVKKTFNKVNFTRDYFKDSVRTEFTLYGGRSPLAYLYEDIGINAMYYYFNIRNPLWVNSKELKVHPRRGEVFLHFYQQLSAKYHLERISMQLPEIYEFEFDGVVDEPYSSMLRYPNGQNVPDRVGGPTNLGVYYSKFSEMVSDQIHIYSNSFLLDSERRIRDGIDIGFIRTRNGSKLNLYENITKGVNLIGNIIEGNADSPNQPFYSSLMYHARHLLGYPRQVYGNRALAPCAVEQLESSLRDKLFWSFIKKIVNLYQRYLYHLPPYTLEDLEVPGVKVEGIDMGTLIKRTEVFKVDLINAVNRTDSEKFGDFDIQLHQVRPKADNFTYKIHVQSETSKKMSFKVFIGPSHNYNSIPVRLSKHRMNMFNLDRFTYNLKEGNNIIVRNITDSPYFTSDDNMFSDTYRKILRAVAENGTYKLETFDLSRTYAWPLRFALPLSRVGGFPFRFFVAAFQENGEEEPLSLLYPFDRPIKNEGIFLKVPNFYSHIASIYFGQGPQK